MTACQSDVAARRIIKSISLRYEANFNENSIDQWVKELQTVSESDLNAAFQRFKQEYESLPYRFSVSAGLLKQLKPTFTTATIEERLYASLKDKDPYSFLKAISPKLEELADQGGLFERAISAKDQGYRVYEIAKRFLEWQANKAKGFEQPEPDRDMKKLEFTSEQFERIKNPYKGLPISEAAKLAAEELAKKEGRTNAA